MTTRGHRGHGRINTGSVHIHAETGATKRAGIPVVSSLRTLCWCERSYIMVDQDRIRVGLTDSCGTARCDALAVRHETQRVG